MTTTETITTEQIESLKRGAGSAGDDVMACYCDTALGFIERAKSAHAARICGCSTVVTNITQAEIDAIEECVEAINAAEACNDCCESCGDHGETFTTDDGRELCSGCFDCDGE